MNGHGFGSLSRFLMDDGQTDSNRDGQIDNRTDNVHYLQHSVRGMGINIS